MTEIHLMTAGHTYWEETISFAKSCSWKAGSFLARKMQKNEFQEWERVCAIRVNGRVNSLKYNVNLPSSNNGHLD